jgi:hypothetical protein
VTETPNPEPIDVTLVAIRKHIEQVKRLRRVLEDGFHVSDAERLMFDLADEAERLADYVGQADPERLVRIARAEGAAGALNAAIHEVEDDDDAELLAHRAEQWEREAATLAGAERGADLFSIQAVVDRVKQLDPQVTAYVEQTGGGCATIYAALRREDSPVVAGMTVDEDAVLYQQPGEPGWGEWPIQAGPGTFDWGGSNHEASLAEFYVGPSDALMADGYETYEATERDTVESLAEQIVAQVRGFAPTRPGVIVWPGR